MQNTKTIIQFMSYIYNSSLLHCFCFLNLNEDYAKTSQKEFVGLNVTVFWTQNMWAMELITNWYKSDFIH